MRLRKFKRVVRVVLVLAIGFAIGVPVYRHLTYSKPVVAPKRCVNIYAPCFNISMPNNPTYGINSWQHYGKWNCVAFTSLPDGGYHGYCGNYKISKLYGVYQQ